MQLTDDDIREFQEIWKAEFNEEITADRARTEGTLLLELFVLLAKHARARRKRSDQLSPP